MELIIELLGEIFIQLLLEIFADFVARIFWPGRISEIQRLGSIFLYGFFGLLAGWISCLLFPDFFIRDPALRIAAIFITALLMGGLMSVLGAFFQRRGQIRLPLESFGYGAWFALCCSCTRYLILNA